MAEPSGRELAYLLVRKAAGDEIVLKRLAEDDDVPDDVLGFHAQQAVEKLIKAVLAYNEVPYERTHNITYLLTLTNGAELSPPPHADRLSELTPWAAEFRYADLTEAALHRQAAVSLVEQARGWAEAELAKPPTAGEEQPGQQ